MSRLEAKLKETIDEKDFYQALQLYKTLYVRYLAKNPKSAEELLFKGILVLLEHPQQVESGTELALLLFKHFAEQKCLPDSVRIANICKLFQKYPPELDVLKRRFISAALNGAVFEKAEYGPVVSPLYEEFGKDFERHGEYYEAEKIYIRGTTQANYSQMLVRWAATVTDTEKDLLITRSVLRYLALHNAQFALTVLCYYLDNVPVESPLINFAFFLIKACAAGAKDIFLILKQKYAPAIARDKSFTKYLDHIGRVYFAIESQKSGMGGLIGNLLKGFAGGK